VLTILTIFVRGNELVFATYLNLLGCENEEFTAKSLVFFLTTFTLGGSWIVYILLGAVSLALDYFS